MKVIIREPYEKYSTGPNSYSFKSKDYEVEPVAINRVSMGRHGAARTRYTYWATVNAPEGILNCHCEDVSGEIINSWINRKTNKSFNPKKLVFIDDVAVIN